MLQPRQIAVLVALTLMWGVNWPMMKFSLRELSPLYFRAITMTGGALSLYLYYRFGRGVDMRWPRAEWRRVALLALPNIIAWHFCSITGLHALASGRAAILGFTMPVWTVLITLVLAHERPSGRVLLSAGAALAAVLMLSWQELAHLAGRPEGVLWMQAAALSWAAGTVLMRRTTCAMPTEAVTVWMMALGSAFFWIVAPLMEPAPQPAAWSTGLWWSLLYGVLLNYGVAQVIWFGMARTLPPSASAFSIMAVPLVGTAAATAIVGEWPRPLDLVAAVAIVLAIASALLPRRQSAA
ncbi:DMT family transporter [Ideonella sp. 4Y11]|uniref:DMT family transporter n=1 Tax=Ideonella aquatica TaxID=2824119 RepID=A0A941BLR2_9BURK|nr:DMT family transporter [Ideonella aquatica]MBQ0961213.1 DMT family transporter [Ideonella aquatica]